MELPRSVNAACLTPVDQTKHGTRRGNTSREGLFPSVFPWLLRRKVFNNPELVDDRRRWYIGLVTLTIELECEEDGRWIAEVPALPGVLCYGQDRDEAVAGVQALALRVIAERLENREAPAELLNVTFQAA
jgi:predicted RNase H-like HicB family nuclease